MIKEEEIQTIEENEQTLKEADAVTDEELTDDIDETASPEEVLESVKEDEAVLNRLVRLQADFENFKKRSQKKKQKCISSHQKTLLPSCCR
jgi:GrpE.